jgi:hypothetical protein
MASPPALSFTLTLLFNEQTGDDWGNWQYAGATAPDPSSQQTVQLIATKRDNSHAGVSFPASMLTATIIFPVSDGPTWAHLTIQGIHDLSSNNETGTVTSASPLYAPYVGGSFWFEGGVLNISPPG